MALPHRRRSLGRDVVRRAVLLARRAGVDVVRYPRGTPVGGHLEDLLGELGVTLVLDVGANVGEYGVLLRRLGYAGRIVSFEPVAANVEGLRSRVDALWAVEHVALGRVT